VRSAAVRRELEVLVDEAARLEPCELDVELPSVGWVEVPVDWFAADACGV
jgi:hypothetical protein